MGFFLCTLGIDNELSLANENLAEYVIDKWPDTHSFTHSYSLLDIDTTYILEIHRWYTGRNQCQYKRAIQKVKDSAILIAWQVPTQTHLVILLKTVGSSPSFDLKRC